MHTTHKRSGKRVRLAAAFTAVMWLLAVLVAPIPASAMTCGTTVFTGKVDPTGGTTATTFNFTVTVTGGPTPTSVQTRLSGIWHAMALISPGVYRWSTKLAVGTYNYRFRVTNANGTCSEAFGSHPPLVVTAAATPVATPKPTPKPTKAPAKTAKPTARPTSNPTTAPNATATAVAAGATGGSPTPSPSASPTRSPGFVVGGGTTTGGSGDGSSPGVLLPIGILVAAVGGGLLLLAYRRRRREDDEGTTGVRVDAAAATVAVAAAAQGPALSESGVAPLADPAIEEDLEPIDEDAPLKKTRRQTKKVAANAALAAAAVERRTFDAPPKKGISRAKVGYRRVRISSEPDAVRSTELGRLDRGDEVEILESYEGFLQVRTPDDTVGWILRHTIVGAPT
jgi:hypothetical protein